MRPILDTGAGVNLIRPDVLPPHWRDYAYTLTSAPHIVDANGQTIEALQAIHLFIDTGGVQAFERFYVNPNLSVKCILVTKFTDKHVKSIWPRLKRIVWQSSNDRSTAHSPILGIQYNNVMEPQWTGGSTKVRACKQTRLKGKTEEWIMVTCDTPGLVTLQPNARLCRHKTMAVARGLATVKPDEPILVKMCNFGPDTAILRKGCVLAFAEPHLGQVLAAPTEDKGSSDPETEQPKPSLDDMNLDGAPQHLHAQIKSMLAKHGKMWDGTLEVIHATERAIVTPPGAAPIKAQPYRTGAFKRAIIVDQINKMLKLKVIKPSHSDWASVAIWLSVL